MLSGRSRRSAAVAAVAAVLVPAVALVVSGSAVEALVLIVVVAALTGMYLLRRYARAELLYRRRPGAEPRPEATAGRSG